MVKRRFQWGTVLQDPAVDGGVIHGDPTFPHEFFHVTRTQGVRDVPAHARENNILGKMRPFEADRHRLSPSVGTLDHRGRAYLKSPQIKIATEPPIARNRVLRACEGITIYEPARNIKGLLNKTRIGTDA
jgi:hypothetical protein